MGCIKNFETIKRLNSKKRQHKDVYLVKCGNSLYVLYELKNRNQEANKIIEIITNEKLKKYIIPIEEYDYTNPKAIKILFEYSKDGNLKEYINRNKKNISKEIEEKFIKDLISIIYDLHKEGYLFGDIKPQNIIIYKNNLKFSDVESIEKYNRKGSKIFLKSIGTPTYKYSYTGARFYTLCDELFGLLSTIYLILTGEKLLTKDEYESIWKKEWSNFRQEKSLKEKTIRSFFNNCKNIDLCVDLYGRVKNKINELIKPKIVILDNELLELIFNELNKDIKNCDVLSLLESFLNMEEVSDTDTTKNTINSEEHQKLIINTPLVSFTEEKGKQLKLYFFAILTLIIISIPLIFFYFKKEQEKEFLIPIACKQAKFLDKNFIGIEEKDGNLEFFKVDGDKIKQIEDANVKLFLLEKYENSSFNNKEFDLKCDSKGVIVKRKN